MARSTATTPEAYLAELPDDRRRELAALRDLVLRALPAGYREEMRWGMISYEVPLERYAGTYNGQPLSYLALAAQKSHLALYLNCAYADPARREWLEGRFREAGKKMDMGKACLRFRRAADLPLESLAELIADIPPEGCIRMYEAARAGR